MSDKASDRPVLSPAVMSDKAFDRSELVSLLLRTAVASAITYLGVKWAVDMMDPTRKRRQDDKKRVSRL